MNRATTGGAAIAAAMMLGACGAAFESAAGDAGVDGSIVEAASPDSAGADAGAASDGATPRADVVADVSSAVDASDELLLVDDAGALDAGVDGDGCTPLVHQNGFGGTYLDCAPLGHPGDQSTYSVSMDEEAVASYTGGSLQGQGTDQGCRQTDGGLALEIYGSYPSLDAAGKCAVWITSGPGAGYSAMLPCLPADSGNPFGLVTPTNVCDVTATGWTTWN